MWPNLKLRFKRWLWWRRHRAWCRSRPVGSLSAFRWSFPEDKISQVVSGGDVLGTVKSVNEDGTASIEYKGE